ncbi:aldehyde dehydrogenase family protein [Marinobacterium weihaiense]|uniref:Aldehyde dehydrogenase family protein n=1 Tax=Marinobacterium weihaiense TaxID=2851016 RepID=A0ABS6MBC1_9GAMM|nr:aldehyde dehydrogenase family protein [Marinobacterium weihaiense]MBV0933606.1 aldehyde dehydrogenase family protein [Marinobacterium weihaiense]
MQTVSTLFINGQAVAGEREAFGVVNPATGEAFAQCPAASPEQVDAAVAAANTAFKTFQHTADADRKAMLHRIADLIDAHADELAQLVTLEQGKPMALAQMEVGAAAGWTRYNADLDIPVKVIEDSETRLAELHHKPLGVVGSITPWNWPLMIAVWHIMPALRTGNTVVSKPSSFTPFSTLKLVELINEVVPAGVINIVTGEGGIGRAMTQHPDIRKIVFTGSTPTGQDIMRKAADNLKRLTLELGGNDAGIVLPGTDLDKYVPALFQTAFVNMGQTCAALKRLYVHESQYDDVCQRLAAIAREQVVGNGLEAGVTFGPVTNQAQLDLVAALVEDARAQGAQVLSGGAVQPGNGYFYPPTIVAGISNGVRLVDEEQFGPVLPVVSYRDIDEAVALANDNINGLGGSVWGNDIEQARSVAARLESGTAWINNHAEVLPHCPFGGSKMSGIGVEFGEEGLLEYTQSQLLNISRG